MHAIEKILAHAAGVEEVKTNDIYEMRVDKAMLHDRSGPKCLEMLKKFDLQDGPIVNPENVLAFFDHDVPSSKQKSATNQKLWRDYARTKGITHIYNVGDGICHQVMMEDGQVLPGTVILGGDSHTTNGGVLGAAATGVGETEMTAVLTTGQLWLRVPPIAKIELNCTEGKEVPHPKTVMLSLLRAFGSGTFIYTGVEFTGSYIDALEIEERSIVSSMSCELGAKFGYIQPDQKAINYLAKHAPGAEYTIYTTDPDFQYSATYSFCVDDLDYLVAQPHGFDDIRPIDEIERVKVDQVNIGTCTGGLLSDIKTTADIVRGKKVAENVRLLVTPVTHEVFVQALEKGYVYDIVKAGGLFNPARCGNCGTSHDGVIAAGETCITNGCRNFRGRLGSTEAKIYLATTAVAAASAIAGRLAKPEEI